MNWFRLSPKNSGVSIGVFPSNLTVSILESMHIAACGAETQVIENKSLNYVTRF
jgi:hypothetical protein